MNFTGCATGFAKDNLLQENDKEEGQCTLPVALYAFSFGFGVFILSIVVLLRIWLILYSFSGKRKQSNNKSAMGIVSPILTVVFSFTGALTAALLLILPFTVQISPYAIQVIFGFQVFAFNAITLRWLQKVVKLGTKVITRRINVTIVLQHQFLLKVLMLMTASLILVQLLLHVQNVSVLGFHIGIGIQALLILLFALAFNVQFWHCESAIVSIVEKAPLTEKDTHAKTLQVVKAFYRQRIIMTVLGIPGCILHVLWALSVIPSIGFGLLVGSIFFNVFSNCLVLLSMAVSFRTREQESKGTTRGESSSKKLVYTSGERVSRKNLVEGTAVAVVAHPAE